MFTFLLCIIIIFAHELYFYILIDILCWQNKVYDIERNNLVLKCNPYAKT